MKKQIALFAFSVLCVSFTSCQLTDNSGVDSSLESSTPSQTTTENNESSVISKDENVDGETTKDFVVNHVTLPSVVDDTCIVLAEGFHYENIVQDNEFEYVQSIAMDNDDIIFMTESSYHTQTMLDDNGIVGFLKYNIETEKTKLLSGNIPRVNVWTQDYALADGKIEGACESNLSEMFRFTVDLRKDTVTIKEVSMINPNTTSFFAYFAFDEKSFMERWYDMTDFPTSYVYLNRYDENGKTEILKAVRDPGNHAFSNNKIYQLDIGHSVHIDILDANGNHETTIYFPQVDEWYHSYAGENHYCEQFFVLGDYIVVNVNNNEIPRETCFLYNLENKTVTQLENCRFVRPKQSTGPETNTWYFYNYNAGKPESNLYRLDREGNITLLAEDVEVSSIVTDGERASYLKGDQLYIVTPE